MLDTIFVSVFSSQCQIADLFKVHLVLFHFFAVTMPEIPYNCIVGKSDFASGILLLGSIFPSFSEYFSDFLWSIYPTFLQYFPNFQ